MQPLVWGIVIFEFHLRKFCLSRLKGGEEGVSRQIGRAGLQLSGNSAAFLHLFSDTCLWFSVSVESAIQRTRLVFL